MHEQHGMIMTDNVSNKHGMQYSREREYQSEYHSEYHSVDRSS